MIEHVVAHLAGHGITRVVLSLGFHPEAFADAYPDGTCAGMNENSPEEGAALLGDVNELVDNDHCHVNTSDIVSVSAGSIEAMTNVDLDR